MQRLGLTLAKRANRLRFRARRLLAPLVGGEPPPRLVFLHIPKTAGSSIGLHFKSHIGSNRSALVAYLDETGDRPIGATDIAAARGAQFVSGHFGWETLQQVRGDAIVVTMLRDPVDRLKSAWLHGIAEYGPEFAARFPAFRDFLACDDPKILQQSDNVMARQLAGSLALPMRDRPLQDLADEAIGHLATFDHVGFVETFEADFLRICALAALPPPRRAPRVNVTADKLAGAFLASVDMSLDPAGNDLLRRRTAADAIVHDRAREMVSARQPRDEASRPRR